jgi:DNA polymerase III subunit delta
VYLLLQTFTIFKMVITLTGENGFAVLQELRQLKAAFVAEHGDIALEQLDGEEVNFERMQEAITSLPFLSNKKMVVLRAPSANKRFTEQAENVLPGMPETTDLVIVEPKPDKRTAYYKFLKKSTEFKECKNLDLPGLSSWLVQQAKEQGGSLGSSDARYLVERVGMNQQLLFSELEKLLIADPNITRQLIDELTEPTPQSTIFQLLDAAFAGKTQQALQIYAEQRALKVEPQQIVAMLSWQLHILAIVKTAGDRSPEQVASEAKLSPYVVKKSAVIASKLSLVRLKELVKDLLAIDINAKTKTYDLDAALQNYIVRLA